MVWLSNARKMYIILNQKLVSSLETRYIPVIRALDSQDHLYISGVTSRISANLLVFSALAVTPKAEKICVTSFSPGINCVNVIFLFNFLLKME